MFEYLQVKCNITLGVFFPPSQYYCLQLNCLIDYHYEKEGRVNYPVARACMSESVGI